MYKQNRFVEFGEGSKNYFDRKSGKSSNGSRNQIFFSLQPDVFVRSNKKVAKIGIRRFKLVARTQFLQDFH